jgi:hypothetical protein
MRQSFCLCFKKKKATHWIDALNQLVERGDEESMIAVVTGGNTIHVVDRDQYLIDIQLGW